MMKKFILLFRRLLIISVIITAELPQTISANSIQRTVNCSVCKKKKQHLSVEGKCPHKLALNGIHKIGKSYIIYKVIFY